MENSVLPEFLQIPTKVLFDESLQPLDLKIYGFISYYSKLKLKKCILSNKELGGMAKATEGSVKNSITRLYKSNHITAVYLRERHQRELVPVSTSSIDDVAGHQDMGAGHQANDVLHITKNIESHIDTKVSIGQKPTGDIKATHGNDEINQLLSLFETNIGHVPADRQPRRVAQNMRMLIKSFVKNHAEIYREAKGGELTYEHMLKKVWQWYMKRDYADKTEKLETVKLKMKIYLDKAAKHYEQEGRKDATGISQVYTFTARKLPEASRGYDEGREDLTQGGGVFSLSKASLERAEQSLSGLG